MENLFYNIIVKNFLKNEKEKEVQVQEAFRTLNLQEQKRNNCRHIIIKTLNVQKKE
jgi:hypothetical protein